MILEKLKNIVKKNYLLYKTLSSDIFSLQTVPVDPYYPTDIGIELTTLCNSKCTFCTHEELVVKTKKKQANHMEYDFAIKVIDKIREITRNQAVPEENIRIGFNGLGEPLLHPNFFDIVKYARNLFPKAYFTSNTNCIALTEDTINKLIECGLDNITLSLAFDDPKDYKKWVGIDKHSLVRKNIENFLKIKGERLPRANLYVFDEYLNRKNFSHFIKHWSKFLNKIDSYHMRKLLSVYDWSPKKGGKFPCYELWNMFMVDITGDLFPCCMALWIEKNESLCLGNILSSSHETIINNINNLREKHISGNYGFCNNCSILIDKKSLCKRTYQKTKRKNMLKVNIR